MQKGFINERVKTLKEISARNTSREIEGCTSWRHYVVHQDRTWLLTAIEKIRTQVEKIRQAQAGSGSMDAEVHELLRMFEEETLDHIGDE